MRYVMREEPAEKERFLVVDTEGDAVFACEEREDAQKVLDMLIKHPAVADRIASGKSRITGVE